MYLQHIYEQFVNCLYRVRQAQQWCDKATYLLANQLVDKVQSKEGAEAALRDIEKFQEGVPALFSSGSELLIMEYEAVLTSQLQVSYHIRTENIIIKIYKT